MYCPSSPGQLSFSGFYLPFGGRLSAENRWVKLAALVPWEEFEAAYAEQFSEKQGAPAQGFHIALGALIIKEKLGLSDRETVQQVQENPYLQYFLGFHEYLEEAPFDASMMTHFRQQLSASLLAKINQQLVTTALVEGETEDTAPTPDEATQASPEVENEAVAVAKAEEAVPGEGEAQGETDIAQGVCCLSPAVADVYTTTTPY